MDSRTAWFCYFCYAVLASVSGEQPSTLRTHSLGTSAETGYTRHSHFKRQSRFCRSGWEHKCIGCTRKVVWRSGSLATAVAGLRSPPSPWENLPRTTTVSGFASRASLLSGLTTLHELACRPRILLARTAAPLPSSVLFGTDLLLT